MDPGWYTNYCGFSEGERLSHVQLRHCQRADIVYSTSTFFDRDPRRRREKTSSWIFPVRPCHRQVQEPWRAPLKRHEIQRARSRGVDLQEPRRGETGRRLGYWGLCCHRSGRCDRSHCRDLRTNYQCANQQMRYCLR